MRRTTDKRWHVAAAIFIGCVVGCERCSNRVNVCSFRQPIPGDLNDPESLAALLQRHLIWMETHHFSAGTVAVRRLRLANFVLWCHERSVTQASDVTRDMLERFQRRLFYYRKADGQPLSISSQAHWLTALRSWFAWLMRERLIPHNPAAELQLPREEQRLPRHALTMAEAVLAMPNLASPLGLRDRAMLETLYSCGLRRAEVLGLTLADLDRERLSRF